MGVSFTHGGGTICSKTGSLNCRPTSSLCVCLTVKSVIHVLVCQDSVTYLSIHDSGSSAL